MLKTILELKDTKRIKREDQKSISGGARPGSPRLCCDPALECCTTTHLALNNANCGGQYQSGCTYHRASGCCIWLTNKNEYLELKPDIHF